MSTRTVGRRVLPILVIGATVALQLAAAVVLDVAASADAIGRATFLAIAAAMGMHVFRFFLWGYAHRRYPLSHTYPLTALFFPFVLMVSHWRGDTVGPSQVAGTLLITLGVAMVAMNGTSGDTSS